MVLNGYLFWLKLIQTRSVTVIAVGSGLLPVLKSWAKLFQFHMALIPLTFQTSCGPGEGGAMTGDSCPRHCMSSDRMTIPGHEKCLMSFESLGANINTRLRLLKYLTYER